MLKVEQPSSDPSERPLLDAIAELCVRDPARTNRNVRPGYLHGEYGVISNSTTTPRQFA